MSRTKISEYSATAADNTDINAINIAEGCAPSGINNAIREMMKQLKDFQAGTAGDPLSVGGNLSYTGTLTGSTGILNIGSGQIYKDASGNVGVGTSSPAARLNVSHADASIPDVIFTNTVASSSAGGAVLILQNSDGAANASGDRLATLIFRGAGDASNTIVAGARISAFAEANFTATSSPTNLRFETTATGAITTTERLRITSAGNVGIGTSSPTARLNIQGGFGQQLVLQDNANNNANKGATFNGAHYANAEEPVLVAASFSTSTDNTCYYGGGWTSANAATSVQFYTAANNTTITGS
jgi:hypothetical protein